MTKIRAMAKLLDYIFIDTSVFLQESFFKETSRVSKLLQLAEKGYVKILFPVITEKEWLKHFKDTVDPKVKVSEAERKLSLLGNNEYANEFLKNLQTAIDGYDFTIEAEVVLNAKTNQPGVVKIDYHQFESTLEDVFEKYFRQDKPFGANGKSKEFPDAFVLASLEKYARENNLERIIVFSLDKDMTDYKSDVLKLESIGGFLDDLLVNRIPDADEKEKQQKDIDRLFMYIQASKPEFESKLHRMVLEYLNNTDVYINHFMYAEIEDVESVDISLDITAKDMEIISIDNEYIEAICFPEVDGVANVCHFCEEESIWDSEEKEWFYEKYETDEVEISSYLSVYVKMGRNELDMGQEPDVEISEVNYRALQESLDGEN